MQRNQLSCETSIDEGNVYLTNSYFIDEILINQIIEVIFY